ncbi:hypothetical protein B9Z38_02600 [Limnohabitans sp. MMS-10A-160]|nr:hypothetical protein B9Z43_08690 [Limnohabitans sp. MMS-10A-192]PUE27198.1 hypothetical protein B9Z38_02600 [Limnohabitans sp. MMS-10A-160]
MAFSGQAFKNLTSVTQNSLLDLMLQTAPPTFAVQLERVFLQQGPMDLVASASFVYFPQDALLSLAQVSRVHDAVNVAVVGRHACAGPAELWAAQMQAVVMVPGHVYRLDWSQVKQDAHVYGHWLWHTTVITHGLIEQMAQTAFCVRHHNATQRLASWLLIALAQHGGSSLQLPLDAVPLSIRQPTHSWADVLDTLQNQQAIEVHGAGMRVLDAGRLAGTACRCHTMVTHSAEQRQPRPL